MESEIVEFKKSVAICYIATKRPVHKCKSGIIYGRICEKRSVGCCYITLRPVRTRKSGIRNGKYGGKHLSLLKLHRDFKGPFTQNVSLHLKHEKISGLKKKKTCLLGLLIGPLFWNRH